MCVWEGVRVGWGGVLWSGVGNLRAVAWCAALSAQGVVFVQQLSCVRCPVSLCSWGAAVCGGRRTPPIPKGDTRSGPATHTVSNPR